MVIFWLCICSHIVIFFFFNDTATTEIYTLSLHDALPISPRRISALGVALRQRELNFPSIYPKTRRTSPRNGDRKSTRLNSSHSQISYAVFCLKKKKHTCNPRLMPSWSHPGWYSPS